MAEAAPAEAAPAEAEPETVQAEAAEAQAEHYNRSRPLCTRFLRTHLHIEYNITD